MDELEQYLGRIKKRKSNIQKKLKKKEEEWQYFCDLLEKGTIRVGAPFLPECTEDLPIEQIIPQAKRLKNAKVLEFIYLQILSALVIMDDRKAAKRKVTNAEKYWKEREKIEEKFWRQKKDPKLVEKMPRFASVPDGFPFPSYHGKRKTIRVVNRPTGRPEGDLRYFLWETLSEPLHVLSSPCPPSLFRSFRSLTFEKLFQILFE